MTEFWRKEHYRNGTVVSGHWVRRGDWSRFVPQNRIAQKLYRIEETPFSSFTIPNATCPMCGSSVFYYENRYGSKVWFDDLGPPWPIHGCFENNSVQAIFSRNVDPNDDQNTQLSIIKLKKLNLSVPRSANIISPIWIPCIIQRNIQRDQKSYITAQIFDEYKKQRTVFLMLNASDISNKNYICFLKDYDADSCEVFYFDVEKMEHGSIKGAIVQNRKVFLFLTKYKQKNADVLEKIKEFIRKAKKLQTHKKVALADWLYSNTVFDNYSLSIFSGLTDLEINQLVNDKLKSTHVPQSPVSLGIVDNAAFSFLIDNIKYIHVFL
jgi:ribosomal protein S27AE